MFQRFDVSGLTLTGSNTIQDLQHPLGTDPTSSTFAARLFLNEVQVEPGSIDHAGIFIHDDQATGTDDRAQCSQGLIIQRRIDVLRRDTATGGSTRLRRFELFPVGDAATDGIDHFGQRSAHGDLHQAGVYNVARQSKHLGARTLFRTKLTEPVSTLQHNRRHRRQRLHVVDNGRFAK